MNREKGQNGLVVAKHRDGAYAVAFSPDGTRVAVGGRDGTLFEWPVAPASEPVRYASVSGRVTSCCYAAASGALAFSNKRDVFFWPTSAPQPLHRFPHPSVETVSIDPGGELIFSGDAAGSGKLWSISRRAELASATLDVRGIIDSQWLPPSQEILVGTAAGEVILLDAADLTVRKRFLVSSKSDLVYRARLSPDRSTFAASYQVVRMGPVAVAGAPMHDYYHIAVWDSDRDGPDFSEDLVGHFDWIAAIAFSPDSSVLASGSADHGIKIWDPYQRRVLSENRAHEGTVHDLAFSPDGTQLVSASADGCVRLWNVPNLATAPPTYWPYLESPSKLDRLQAALDVLLTTDTERDLEVALDGIARVAKWTPLSMFAIPTGELQLCFEDLGGLTPCCRSGRNGLSERATRTQRGAAVSSSATSICGSERDFGSSSGRHLLQLP